LYDKFFGFKESPFNPGPDPRFLYLSQSHREALASMVYGIEQRRGFIAITGEVGSGKTTLIHSLLSNLDNKTHTAFIFYPSGTYSDLLRNILIEFDIDTEGKSDLELRLQFHHFVIDQFRKARNVALIFDEAQNMSPDVLEHLINSTSQNYGNSGSA
jgi:general secretion pathway protein A